MNCMKYHDNISSHEVATWYVQWMPLHLYNYDKLTNASSEKWEALKQYTWKEIIFEFIDNFLSKHPWKKKELGFLWTSLSFHVIQKCKEKEWTAEKLPFSKYKQKQQTKQKSYF